MYVNCVLFFVVTCNHEARVELVKYHEAGCCALGVSERVHNVRKSAVSKAIRNFSPTKYLLGF